MAQAPRDENKVPTLIGVSSADGITPVTIFVDPTTHRVLVDLAGGGSGDVVGPASATNNAIVRYDGTTGKLIQDYTSDAPVISDPGDMTLSGTLSGAESVTIDASGSLLFGACAILSF